MTRVSAAAPIRTCDEVADSNVSIAQASGVAPNAEDSFGGQLEPVFFLSTKDMRPILQYLQLQSQMQSENRSYTAVSNIMKTKHDTVKNSINNIR